VRGRRFGPYVLEDVLGRGGMGEVHRARDLEHGDRVVAVKVLPAALSANGEYRARFQREARIAAGLSEPHIPAVHRYGEIDGRLFLDMTLVPGRTLAALLRERGRLEPAVAVAVVTQIAAALDAAHAAGLLHRDVKPANILVAEEPGQPMHATLIDFGIAAPIDPGSRTALTRTGVLVGTVAYTAPERFLADRPGPTSDVYGLACVLHEALTGQRPFTGTDAADIMAGHLYGPLPRPSAVRAGLPGGFDDVVARGLAKQPQDRYPSAGALAAAATAALSTAALGTALAPAPAEPAVPGTAGPTPTLIDPEPPAPVGSALPTPTLVAAGHPAPQRRSWWLPAGIGIAAGGIALVVVLVAGAAPPAPQAPAPVDPSGGPLTDRTFIGLGDADPAVAWIGDTPVLVPQVFGPVQVRDLATGAAIGAAVSASTSAATVARHGGRTLLVAGILHDPVIRVWDLATGEPLPVTMAGHAQDVQALAVAPVNGRDIVVSSSYDGTVRRWDLETGAPIGAPLTFSPSTGSPDRLQIVHSGERPAVLGDGLGGCRAWDPETGAEIGPPTGDWHAGDAGGVLGGRLVVTSRAINDDPPAPYSDIDKSRLRDMATQNVLDPSVGRTDADAIVESSGVPLLVWHDDAAVQLIDLRSKAQLPALTGHTGKVWRIEAFTVGDHGYLLTRGEDRTVRLWDLSTRTPR
jgi:WD40 repeat protein